MIECVVSRVWQRSVLLRSSNLVIKSYKKWVFSLFVLLYMTLFILLLNWTICTSCISLLRETREARAPRSTSSETSSFFSLQSHFVFFHMIQSEAKQFRNHKQQKKNCGRRPRVGQVMEPRPDWVRGELRMRGHALPLSRGQTLRISTWAENVPASPAAAETRPPDFKGREKAGVKIGSLSKPNQIFVRSRSTSVSTFIFSLKELISFEKSHFLKTILRFWNKKICLSPFWMSFSLAPLIES